MPVIFKQSLDTSLFTEVWKISESEAFFLSRLTLGKADKQKISSLSLPSRRLEKLACRMALKDLLQENSLSPSLENLHYSIQGAPLLEPYRLSFSHSGQYAAVAFSLINSVGIDIEKIGTRLEKLYSRFMSAREIAACNLHDPCELHYYWSAKEAIYKAHILGNIDYRNDILILPAAEKGYLCKDGVTHAFRLWQKQTGDYCIVVARPE